jgi:hypothetical protein
VLIQQLLEEQHSANEEITRKFARFLETVEKK